LHVILISNSLSPVIERRVFEKKQKDKRQKEREEKIKIKQETNLANVANVANGVNGVKPANSSSSKNRSRSRAKVNSNNKKKSNHSSKSRKRSNNSSNKRKNIININVIMSQNNVENINTQNNIQNITPQGEINLLGNSNNITVQESNIKTSNNQSKKRKIVKKTSKDESILTYLLGNNKSKANENDDNNENDCKETNGPDFQTMQDLNNIMETIKTKVNEPDFTNNFISPILNGENPTEIKNQNLNVNAITAAADKINSIFNNSNFYSVVYEQNELNPNTQPALINTNASNNNTRPIRFPVEDKIIYDDPQYYALTNYHLNVTHLF